MLKNIPSNSKGALHIARTYRWFMEDQHRIYERPIMFIGAVIFVHNHGIISNGRYEDCWKAFRQAMERRAEEDD